MTALQRAIQTMSRRTLSRRVTVALLVSATAAWLTCAGLGKPVPAAAAPLAQTTAPQLAIPDNIPSGPTSTVRVPVQFRAAGQRVSGVAFPIDYDENCLIFDLTDADGDSIPDAIQFGALGAFNKSVSLRPGDPNTELIFVIADFSQPIATLETETLVTITFTTQCTPGLGETIFAPVQFAALPLPSFGGPNGRSVSGGVRGGGVLIGDMPITEPTATLTVLPAATPTATPSPTPSLTPTSTPPTPLPSSSPTPTFTPSPTPTPIVGDNVAPVARFDAAGTLQGQPVLIDPLANDWDGNADPLTLAAVADPPAGNVTVDSQGRLLYTPDASFSGFDGFTYVARIWPGRLAWATWGWS